MEFIKLKRNNNYSINEFGQIRNDVTGVIKKPTLNKTNNYYYVDIYENGKRSKVTVHRLMAETFIPNADNKPCVDHINGDRTNNCLSNLRWASYSENNSRFGTLGVRSEGVVVTRYKEERKKRGGGHLKWLEEIETLEFYRISDCAKYFGTSVSNISLMLKNGTIGRRGKMRGYKFQHKKLLKV